MRTSRIPKANFLFALLMVIDMSCGVNKQPLKVSEMLVTQWAGDELHPRFSPDGKQLLVASNEAGKYGIYLINANGSDKRRLTGDSIIAVEPFWSPDGKQIGYRSHSRGRWSITIQSLENGSAKSVFDDDSIQAIVPDWSPDGQRLAFTGIKAGRANIYTLDIATSTLQKQTDGGDEYFPKWSHHSNQLAYYVGQRDSIMILDVVSKETKCVNKGRFIGWRPVFSPSDKELAFISESGGRWDLWVTPVGEPSPVQITTTGFDDYPNWSPDGRSIALSRLVTVNQLYALSIESQKVSQLTSGLIDKRDYRLSIDEKQIVYGSSLDDQIWSEEITGRASGRLTRDFVFENRTRAPYWSPTEDSVVFVNQTFFPGGSSTDLYLVDAKSGSTKRITETGSATNPVWAKNGKIYFSQRDGKGFNQIHQFNPRTLETRQITDGSVSRVVNDVLSTSKLLFENSNGLFTLSGEVDNKVAKGRAGAFSPDGMYIAYISNFNEEKWDDIYMLDVESGETTRLTRDRYSENTLSWSKDGHSIFFNANRGDKDIWIIKLKQ